jgi:hypothetical protein
LNYSNRRTLRHSLYIEHPTDSEAEGGVLVRVPAAADYFLSFGEEKVRAAAEHAGAADLAGWWPFFRKHA